MPAAVGLLSTFKFRFLLGQFIFRWALDAKMVSNSSGARPLEGSNSGGKEGVSLSWLLAESVVQALEVWLGACAR